MANKYRGKWKNNNEWVYGSLLIDVGVIACWIDEDTKYNLLYVGPETIGQLMPIKDTDGLDLYEGDIVCGERTPDMPMSSYFDISAANKRLEYREVKFTVTEGRAEFHLPKDISYSERIKENNIKWKLVGNKWDNPELLANIK